MPLGPRAAAFLLLMFAIGLLSSWLGTLCWNEASQRLPPTLAGQLIVFETLAALAYACAARQRAGAGRRWSASRCWSAAWSGRCARAGTAQRLSHHRTLQLP